jgi:hypothetical protein
MAIQTSHAPRWRGLPTLLTAALPAVLTAVLLAALTLAACNREEPAPTPLDDGALKLERAYSNQKLAPGGKADYRFQAEKRGAYLIMVYGNPSPLQITLKHPKKTCYLLGNGSCELVSGPDEAYGFEVASNADREVQYNVMVTHSEGRGRFEGDVARPVGLDAGGQHSGTVGVNESSYYSFSTQQPGMYTIALSGTQSDLVWRLFDSPSFDVILQECDYQRGAADEACRTSPLHPNHRYYVKVQELSGVPGPYRLAVYQP